MDCVRQRADWDCAVAALNTIAPGLLYESIVGAVARLDPDSHGRRGLYNREVVALAAGFGIALAPTRRRAPLEAATGILRVAWHRRSRRAKANPGGHFCAVASGRVFDPADGTVTPWRTYAARHGARLGTLLERV